MRITTSPPVAAAAMAKLPASMRSGMTRVRAPCRAATPMISILGVPAPRMMAPIRLRCSARATTSGSQAAFLITVVPLARQAAIIRFSVPVWLG